MLNQQAMIDILLEFLSRGNLPAVVNCETNATVPLKSGFAEFLREDLFQWHWSMSPKLFTVSGEKNKIDPDIISSYMSCARNITGVGKFVINGTDKCWVELEEVCRKIQRQQCDWNYPLYVMPVGATKDDQEQPEIGDMCIEAMKRGYKVAPRVQCYVWGNRIGR